MSQMGLLGIALVVVSLVFFLLEIKTPGGGVLGGAGLLALVAGLLLLLGFSWASVPIILALAIPMAAVVAFLAVLAHRAHNNKVVTGHEGMIGLEGRAETDLLPKGKVFVRGELWEAVCPVHVERGASIRVTGVNGLRLEVTTPSADHVLARTHSVIDSHEG